jgi:hypothetical protein
MLSSLRLVLRVDVLPGDEYHVAHATDGLWSLLDHLGPTRRPKLLRGDKSWGIERVMSRAEQNDLAYLFRLRMTANVKRDLVRPCATATGWMPVKVGKARKPVCACLVGAGIAVLFCCAANWRTASQSATEATLPNRC